MQKSSILQELVNFGFGGSAETEISAETETEISAEITAEIVFGRTLFLIKLKV